MENNFYLANNTMVGGSGETSTGTIVPADPAQADVASGAPSFFGSGNMQLLLTMAAVFAVMYFFTIRPQKKREQQLKEIQNSIRSGDWVVTFSGMYGKVVDVGTDIIMVEFGSNKGVKIPVKKTELTKTTEPSLTSRKDDLGEDK